MSEVTIELPSELQQDLQLMKLMIDHPTAAVAALYDRYGKLIFRVALRIVGDRGIAEEITQDVFVSCWHNADRYHPDRGSVVTWLLSIAHHRAIDELRSRRHRNKQRELTWDQASKRALTSESGTDLMLIQSQVRTALNSLPANQREVVELLYFGGLSRQEVAERLRAPLGTIHSRLRLAMNKLRNTLLCEYGESQKVGTEQ